MESAGLCCLIILVLLHCILRNNSSAEGKIQCFGAVVLASLPAVGGGILRDVIVNRDQPAVLQSAQNVSIVLILVASTYLLMQLPLQRISVFKKVSRIHWLNTKSLIISLML